jgi:hypothetical protein
LVVTTAKASMWPTKLVKRFEKKNEKSGTTRANHTKSHAARLQSRMHQLDYIYI